MTAGTPEARTHLEALEERRQEHGLWPYCPQSRFCSPLRTLTIKKITDPPPLHEYVAVFFLKPLVLFALIMTGREVQHVNALTALESL